MRTSNKILLGTFLTILVILTAIHTALYAKFRQKEFITLEELHEERYSVYNLKDVRAVSLSGLQNVVIIPADTARLEIEKNVNNNRVHYQLLDGVLTIKGDTLVKGNNPEPDRINSYNSVILYLPLVQQITANYSDVAIHTKKGRAAAGPYTMQLKETNLHLGGSDEYNDTLVARFNQVTIDKAIGSTIDTRGRVFVSGMKMNLESSAFEDGNMSCDSLYINPDDNSSIKISGRNIGKVKFAGKP